MVRKITSIAAVVLMMLATVGCGGNRSDSSSQTELIISAAASLTDSLIEIQALYEKDHGDVRLIFNFGSSGTLQQQIEQGAPADLFLSAGKKQMKALVDKKLIEAEQQTGLLRNELVVVVSVNKHEKVSSMGDLIKPEFGKLALGEPETVPAGTYTKESLEHDRLWDQLQPKLVYAKDVRQVLTYVESGNADAGFVYKTDAFSSKKVTIASVIDPSSHSPIEYPVGIVKATKYPEEAQQFYAFLQSGETREIFAKFGFSNPANE
ncbi:molybdate ABC transporter substrate-binding protein [Cohnella luojiensis]|uniref:Molybdate ABC transporter substrate-binding protein n=1 Tax=Cohnella luojiensis TaxID=652876 RepID=A0A4Y8LUC5_9BACL|nr:molybdate ABC transporter substrate-binding protein [Cohnella luojiensis]TFE23363.1 molybdate ABC transporter substrate-binding protein [Cohnella luojiensis]